MRLKQVYTDYDELARVWVERWKTGVQVNARTPTCTTKNGYRQSRMYFEEAEIFSYGSHWCLARLVRANGKELALVKVSHDSPTTKKHERRVRGALRRAGIAAVTVSSPDISESALRGELETGIQESFTALCRKRGSWHIGPHERLMEEANSAVKFYGWEPFPYPDNYTAVVEKIHAREAIDALRPKALLSGFVLRGEARAERIKMHQIIQRIAVGLDDTLGAKLLKLKLPDKILIAGNPFPEAAAVVLMNGGRLEAKEAEARDAERAG